MKSAYVYFFYKIKQQLIKINNQRTAREKRRRKGAKNKILYKSEFLRTVTSLLSSKNSINTQYKREIERERIEIILAT